MTEDGLPKWWKTINLRAVLLGAVIFLTATILGTLFVKKHEYTGAQVPMYDEINIPKG